MSNKNQSASTGSGIGFTLFCVFLVLKLCGVIDWSWWWVSAPIWIPLLIAIVLWVIVLILMKVKK